MGRHYSNDLRERVAAAALSGRSCREVAALFSVSVASAVKWSQRLRQTGSASAKPQGRQQPRALAPHQAWILGRLEEEKDLTMRALALELGELPLRFHPNCPRGSERFPAMLALMTDPVTSAAVGVHRTYLKSDGSGKAELEPSKMMIGNAGVIRLVPDEEVTLGLGIAEGIENSLAVMQFAGWRPVWAAGSAGSIAKFPVLPGVQALTIFADHDEIKPNGKQPGLDAARACADHWRAAGREVTIIPPKFRGDWNDVARGVAA